MNRYMIAINKEVFVDAKTEEEAWDKFDKGKIQGARELEGHCNIMLFDEDIKHD